jgi:hypothetical protein
MAVRYQIMTTHEWLTAGEIVERMTALGVMGRDGHPYDPQIVKRWASRSPMFPLPRKQGTTTVHLYNWTKVQKWLIKTGRLTEGS